MEKRRDVRYYLAGVIALITLGVYLVALQNKFVEWDDSEYVFRNSYIRLINLNFFKWAFSTFYASNWHPLTWISHALDYAIWGLKPLGHHLTSILLHAVNTFIVVLVSMKLIRPAGEGASGHGTGSVLNERGILIAAGVTGFLFGLHPLHVESAAWVAERKDLLCAVFFLLSISSYSSYVRTLDRDPASPRGSSALRMLDKRYLLTLLFFVLALLSKPMAVSLPVVLLVLDWFPFQRIRSLKTFLVAVQEKIPFIALSAISSVLTVLAQRVAIGQMESVPLSTRILVAAKSLIAYLAKMMWPNLNPYYPYPNGVSLLSPEYLVPILLVAGITVFCLAVAGKNKLWLAAWGYYVITLFPVLGIVQVGGQAMADRYTYLPSLGPFIIVGILTSWFFVRLGKRGVMLKGVCAVAALALAVTLSYLTFKQIAVWKDSIELWSYVIKKDRTVYNAYNNRGLAFSRMGELDKAIEDFNAAIALNFNYPNAHANMGIALLQKGLVDQAIEKFQTTLRLNPGLAEAHIDLGSSYAKKGWKEKALEEYETAVKANPAFADAYYWLGTALEDKGLFDAAIAQWQTAVRMKPNYPEAHDKLAGAFRRVGRTGEALEHYRIVVKLRPDDALAHLNLGAAYGNLGSFDKAVEQFEIAIRINPGLADARYDLGAAYEARGLMDQAIEQYEVAARLNPADEAIRRDLERAKAIKARRGQ